MGPVWCVCIERGRHPVALCAPCILVYGSIVFYMFLKHIKESFILAQKERWQRALHMQVER